MGLRRGGASLAATESCGGGVVLDAPLDRGGAMVVTGGCGGGHTSDLISDENCSVSHAPSRGARVPVGKPCGPIRIRAVWLYGDLSGMDSGTGMTSTGSSSLSMTATMTTSSSSSVAFSSSSLTTASSPSPSPGDEDTGCHYATGYGHGPVPWMGMAVPGDSTGRRRDQRVPLAYRPVDRGKKMEAIQEP
jgi:hypothetical protein